VAPLHPAEHRGYRELYLAARRLTVHWGRLARFLAGEPGGEALRAGARDATELLDELAPLLAARDLHARPAADGVGTALGAGRAALGDRFLERNQAVRLAALDLRHVLGLLAYLGAVARGRGEDDLAGLCERWRGRLRASDEALDAAVAALAADPDRAVAPLDPSLAGRAAHGLAWALGSVGEWLDRRGAGAAGRRR
jgi:hypothetical protein